MKVWYIAYCTQCGKAGLRKFDKRGYVIALPADPIRYCPRCKAIVKVYFKKRGKK